MLWSLKIKNIREKLCLSQNDFALLIGVSFVSVNRWENGHFRPTLKAQRKILKFCRENNIEVKI